MRGRGKQCSWMPRHQHSGQRLRTRAWCSCSKVSKWEIGTKNNSKKKEVGGGGGGGGVGGGGWRWCEKKKRKKRKRTYASIKKAAQPPCKLPSGLSISFQKKKGLFERGGTRTKKDKKTNLLSRLLRRRPAPRTWSVLRPCERSKLL